MKGFSRFIVGRGRPSIVFSYNGTNFVGAANDLSKLSWECIAKHSAIQRIDWRFNPPSAAWWGGWWERVVRLVKHLLRRILAKACVNYEDMLTVLCDCEATINSRPLTYISSDCNDLATLTPDVFLKEVKEIGIPDLDTVADIDLRGKMRYCQKLKNDLRQRFRSEYLGQLWENAKRDENRKLNIGDLVFDGNDEQKRVDWLLGRIVAIFTGRDCNARVYRIKTKQGELTRPIQRLYTLEIDQPIAKKANGEVSSDVADNNRVSQVRDQYKESLTKNKILKENGVTTEANSTSEYKTRSGRRVKPNRKFDK